MPNRRNRLAALLTMIAAAACAAPAAADAAGPRVGYVTSVNGNSISTFDAFTGIAGGPLALSGHLWGVAITPDGATAYVANESTDSVIPIDTATDTLGTPIPVGSSPRLIGIAPDGATAYVANIGSASVTPIDIATNTPDAPIPVGSGPHGIAISPDGSRVYVSNIFSDSVSVIDTATQAVVATVPVGNLPYTLAITPDGSTVYVTNVGSPNVWAIDTATNTTGLPIPVGPSTYGVAVSPDGDTAYVSASDAGWVIPLDIANGNAPGTPIVIGSLPEGLAITPDGSTAYVTDIGTDSMWSLDLASGTYTPATPTGQDPTIVAITPNRSPTAAFDATVDAATATLDASPSTDSDGTVASYAWDFGDGQTATTTQPTVSHSYAQPGSYAVTLTVTDDEGCSDALVFTGQTASCTGSPSAQVTQTVNVPAPAAAPGPTPPVSTAVGQSIERFALDGKCVRRARDGRARIGLRLRLAVAGSVAISVDRAVAAKSGRSCPKPRSDRRYTGRLRRVTTIDNAATQPVAAAVRRRLTRHVELSPGLYRIAVRAYAADGELTRPAYRWVRVLADRG